ncbi:phosphoribosylformylglycinamidine synthase subunit PurS [Thermoplasmatales archaeon AK]|nr:phosphoribosylformylglycinamidine synthase subunit PurS [Thermoplasmatales archaeon AK]
MISRAWRTLRELKIKGSKQKAMKVAKEISETILTNPVIQEYDMSD